MRWRRVVLLGLVLTSVWAWSAEAQEGDVVGKQSARLDRGQEVLEQSTKSLWEKGNQQIGDLRSIFIAWMAAIVGVLGALISISRKLGRIETLIKKIKEKEAEENLGREEIKQIIREGVKRALVQEQERMAVAET